MLEQRKIRRKSLLDVSNETGISVPQLNKYENKGVSFTGKDLDVLSEYYDIKTDHLELDVVKAQQPSKFILKMFYIKRDEDYKKCRPTIKSVLWTFISGVKLRSRNADKHDIQNYLFSPEKIVTHTPYLYLKFTYVILLLALISISNVSVVLSNVFISMLIPVMLLILLTEMDYPREIKGVKLLKYFLYGGTLSITIVYLFRGFVGYSNIFLFSDFLTGLVEESAKIIVVFLILRKHKIKHVLTGMLIGFAVGAGFDVFETTDYGIMTLTGNQGTFIGMQLTLLIRSFYSLVGVGHHFWASILGGTLVYVSRSEQVRIKDFGHPIFIIMFLIVMSLHAMWNFTNAYYTWPSYTVVILISLFIFLLMFYVAYTKAKIEVCRLVSIKAEEHKERPKLIGIRYRRSYAKSFDRKYRNVEKVAHKTQEAESKAV